MLDYKRRVADDGAEKFLFGDLFEVGEAEFREEFLCTLGFSFVCIQGKEMRVLCNGSGQLLETQMTGCRKRRWRHRMCGGK